MKTIAEKFRCFCYNLTMTDQVINAVRYRYHQITRRLNIDFYNWDSDTLNSMYVGSYGRGTAIHASDIDIIFQMPEGTYQRYNNYWGNGQSQLLQDVKKSVQRTYSSTEIRGDGQVVVVTFSDGIKFEVVPVVSKLDNTFFYPDTNDGGRWRTTDPRNEIAAVKKVNDDTNGTMRDLCRMIRAWKDNCNVPLGGLQIDTFAADFLDNWLYATKSYLYYDWLTRDFFKWLSECDDKQAYWHAVGSNQCVYNRGSFAYKAKQAYNHAISAIEYEKKEYGFSANQQWREIYGYKFPNE